MAYDSPFTVMTPPATKEGEMKQTTLNVNAMSEHPGTTRLTAGPDHYIPGKETMEGQEKVGSKKPGDKKDKAMAINRKGKP